MASLTEKEKALLKKLQDKAEAPDSPGVTKSVSASIDLSDEKQVALAIKHGFLTEDEVEEMEEEEKDKDKDKKGDTTPRRRSYFKDGEGEK